ncbi:MAG: hypothetical protein JWP87_764, partial [Labilithrix sp.]|nr:hypothetical protein [Labilithrix sp.]
TDGIKNGDETDVDCGGKACGACTVGKVCNVPTDCRSNACTNNACACPKDMTIIALSTGGAYCIDSAEVSKGQYNKFITANVPVTTQTGACLTSNADFVPRGAWPPAAVNPTLAFNLGLPVHYVDWCDAFAYCKWASKQLCGTIGGGTLAAADRNTAAKSAWYNACSAQGTKTYPYGNTYSSTFCNGDGVGSAGGATDARGSGFGFSSNGDTGVYEVVTSDAVGNITAPAHAGCQGGSVGVYQMSGNVAEWEDSCDGTLASSSCAVRGGSYNAAADPAALTCASARTEVRMPAVADPDPLADIGFRCCVY